MHLPFALGIELFSLFATLITLPLSSQLFESIKHLFKFSREENVVVRQKKRNAPKFKHKQRKKTILENDPSLIPPFSYL